MKRFSDSLSPSRWKRICPPADDSDTDTEESLDLDFSLLSELWNSRLCNHCHMPAPSCTCSPRRNNIPTSTLLTTMSDSEPQQSTSTLTIRRAMEPGRSPAWERRVRFNEMPQVLGSSNSDGPRTISFRASTSVETYTEPTSEREPIENSLATTRSLREILNRTSMMLSQELMSLSGRDETTLQPSSQLNASTSSPVVESLRREASPTAEPASTGNDSSSGLEVEIIVNRELDEFHTRMLSLIECPVCLEPIAPPIHQCRRGHLVCAKCKTQLSQCPTCRDRLCESRNWAVERIAELLKYPCRNSSSGCSVTVLLLNKTAHEALCPYRPYSCLFRSCSFTGFQPDLLPHLRDAHLHRFLEGNKHEIDVELNSPTLFFTDWAISCFDRVFRFNVFQHIPNFMFYASAYLIGGSGFGTQTVAQPSDFTYTITVSGSQGRKISFTRETHPDSIRTTQLCHAEDCFVLRGDKLDNFAHSNGSKLRLLVELQRSQHSDA